jgi:hypothetical protein
LRSPPSFSYRAITERPFFSARELSPFSSTIASGGESLFVLPDLDLTPSPVTDRDRPTFSKVVKQAAVQALSVCSRRDPL